MGRMRERRHRTPFVFGVRFTDEYEVPRPKFVFQFAGGTYGGEEREPGAGAGSGGGTGGRRDYISRLMEAIEGIRSYLLSRAGTKQERIAINNAFDVIKANVEARMRAGGDEKAIYKLYLDSAENVKKYFDAVWAFGGRVEPLLGYKTIGDRECLAKSTPVQTAAGCRILYLCHKQGIFSTSGEAARAGECGKTREGGKRKLYDVYAEEVEKLFVNLKRQAPTNEDRGIINEMAGLFKRYGERLILEAPDLFTAERNYEMLRARAAEIGKAVLEAWTRRAHLKRSGSRKCPYITTEFSAGGVRIPEAGAIRVHYEFCEDKNGVLQAIARPSTRQPIKPGPIRPPSPLPPGQAPPSRPPIRVQPIRPPEESPIKSPPGGGARRPQERVCGRYRGTEICIDEKAGVATIGGRRHRIVSKMRSTSYGANEVVYDAAKIHYVKPYTPPIGSTRKCPASASIIYVYNGKVGMPDRTYTIDNKVCHAAFNAPAKTPLSIYLVAPEKPVTILASR